MRIKALKGTTALLPLAALFLAGCSSEAQHSDASASAQSAGSDANTPATSTATASADTLLPGTVDGKSVSWSLWTTQSDFTGNASNGTVSVTGMKVSGPDDIGNLAFGFALVGGQPKNVEITLEDGDHNRSFYLSSSSANPLTLTKAEKSGEELHLAGEISASLGYSEDHGQSIDDSKSRAVKLTFDIKLDSLSH